MIQCYFDPFYDCCWILIDYVLSGEYSLILNARIYSVFVYIWLKFLISFKYLWIASLRQRPVLNHFIDALMLCYFGSTYSFLTWFVWQVLASHSDPTSIRLQTFLDPFPIYGLWISHYSCRICVESADCANNLTELYTSFCLLVLVGFFLCLILDCV